VNMTDSSHHSVLLDNTITSEEWIRRWKVGQIGFHKLQPHDDLIKHENQVLPEPGSVLIPLCGKTVDMKYLADKGHKVVGIEMSETGVVDFFKEQSMNYSRKNHPTMPFEVFAAESAGIVIYLGNLFDSNLQMLGQFDAIWDRGAFVAINSSEREKYCNLMATLLKPNGAWLLNCCEYDGTKYGGPPHSIGENEVKRLLTDKFIVAKLDTYDLTAAKFGLDVLTTVNYMIKPISV